jgi:hypothetical protein
MFAPLETRMESSSSRNLRKRPPAQDGPWFKAGDVFAASSTYPYSGGFGFMG